MTVRPTVGPKQQLPHLHPNGKAYEVILERPRILQAMALILLVVSFVGLVYLAVEADKTKRMLQVLGFFGTLWAVRNILLTGVTVFPIGIDYLILGLFLLAAMMLMFRFT